jgi:hypothetical protein
MLFGRMTDFLCATCVTDKVSIERIARQVFDLLLVCRSFGHCRTPCGEFERKVIEPMGAFGMARSKSESLPEVTNKASVHHHCGAPLAIVLFFDGRVTASYARYRLTYGGR